MRAARPYHHGNLPAALLARAEETLRERGLEAITLRGLARDIGVSNAAPSRHFKDRQALLDALALSGFERLNASLEAAASSGATLPERLRALALAYLRFAVANAELLDIMYTVKHGSDASAALVESGKRTGAILLATIEEAQRTGQVRPGPPERVGLPLFAALHGYAALVTGGMIPADQAELLLPDVTDPLLRAVRPEGDA
ncbi:TetR/AcrR family transcriptional regulator [Streptomyces sp. DSM 44917]|uniref:TetR/AcrR family transcriptional regulator n=1 Tax=Streptomyces boetiae TaxID=3075541 RepID=A0ABU2L8U6_9ACTN|nr:TetR/AcrR family transcriptional regulator [Streptomyces sp. DSM 44917]MDT0308000.1 TetR/AcrR family transcriptional regulator [Streptomyces sp. DSM 44917]